MLITDLSAANYPKTLLEANEHDADLILLCSHRLMMSTYLFAAPLATRLDQLALHTRAVEYAGAVRRGRHVMLLRC